MEKIIGKNYIMLRFITTICFLFFLFSPITTSAQESSKNFDPAEISSDNLIPIFLFKYRNRGFLSIVPIEEDLFLWIYTNPINDPIGNITNKSDIGNYSYSQTNKTNPHAVTTAGSTTYTYDNNGNITGDGTHTYTWDYNNRLESSTTGGTTYNYYYDHEGDRVKKVSGANTTTYINKYYEIYPDGKIKKYIYGGDDNIAIIETLGSTKTPYYVHKDHLGGSSVITDSNGDKAELVDYYPYGSTKLDEKSGIFENNRKFTGKELDSETGL